MTYDDWIAAYRRRVGDTSGKCKEACEEMLKAFPELKMRRGHVLIAFSPNKKPAHWWLVDPRGNVIKPNPRASVRTVADTVTTETTVARRNVSKTIAAI
jgi:hypothetical protein